MKSFSTSLRVFPQKLASIFTMLAMLTSSFAGLAAIPSVANAATPTTVCSSGCDYNSLQDAVNAAAPGDTIDINSDLSIASRVDINTPITIEGHNHTIEPTFAKSSNSNNASIGITGVSGVTISNLTINGTHGTDLHGINVYESTNVHLNNVTVKNNNHDGVVVDGSSVTVDNITTSNNTWGGIDVDQGSGVTQPAVLTVNGTSVQSELFADIYVDDTTKNVTVNDTNNQYAHAPSGIPGRSHDQVYTLKPPAPTLTGFKRDGHTLSCSAVTNKRNDTHITWAAPSNPVQGYKLLASYPDGHTATYPSINKTHTKQEINTPHGFGWHGNGVYSYTLEAKANGVWSNASAPCTLIYDTISPVVSVTPQASDGTLSGTVSFTITVTDQNLEPMSPNPVYVYLYNTDLKSQPKYGTNVTFTHGVGTFTVDTTKLPNGTYSLDVGNLRDAAGNPTGIDSGHPHGHDVYFPGYTISNSLTPSVTTDNANGISSSDATLNGTNGPVATDMESFWVATSTFSTASSNIPGGVYSTPTLPGVGAGVSFSDLLSLVTTNGITTGGVHANLPAITPNTTYYYAAWARSGGTWYPGAVKSFTTSSVAVPSVTTDPATHITPYNADLNGTVGSANADQTVFWIATSTFSTADPNTFPSGVYSTGNLGSSGAGSSFTSALSLLTTTGVPSHLPAIQPGTTYYYVAWALVGGTWHAGALQSFTTTSIPSCNPQASSPALTTFDDFANGSPNGQHNWTMSGSYDAAVVDNTYGYSNFGCKALRISDAVTSGSFGDWVFSAPVATPAGEASVAADNHYEVSFDFASTKKVEQPGMQMSVAPTDSHGNRMSYLGFKDESDGTHVIFYDVTNNGSLGTSTPTTWNEHDIATVPYGETHNFKLAIDFKPGPGNDVVKVSEDGTVIYTGTSWEDYYRYDPEQNGNGNVLHGIDRLILQARGSSHVADNGNGYLFDNVKIQTSNIGPALPFVTTSAATSITTSDAMLNGIVGPSAATQESFWVATSTFSTSSTHMPNGVYSTPILSGIGAGAPFSDLLSLVTTSGIVYNTSSHNNQNVNMAAITPSTKYYYVAWAKIGGTWYHGDVKSFTTAAPPDTTRPTLVYNYPSTGAWATSTLPVSVTASDSGSGINSVVVHYYHNGSFLGACGSGQSALGGVASSTYTCALNTSGLADGNYSLRSGTFDVAGNNQTVSRAFGVDNTKPTASITAPAQGSTQTGTFTITGNATDTTSGVDHIDIYVEHDPWSAGGYVVNKQLATYNPTTGDFSYHVSGIPDGTYDVKAVVYDKAGNVRYALSGNAGLKIKVVNTVPTLNITAPATNGDYATSTYAFTAEYNHGVTTHLSWAIRSGANASCSGGTTVAGNVDGKHSTSTFSGGTFTTSLDTTQWTDGAYCFVVNDLHGLRPVRTFTVDNTAPATTTITAPTDGQTFTSEPILDSWTPVVNDVNGTPDASGITGYQIAYAYDDGHTFGGSTCPNVTKIDGYNVSGCRNTTGTSRNHTPGLSEQGGVRIFVRVFDGAGNVSAWSTPVHYVYDTSYVAPPTPSVTTNAASSIATSTVTINGTNGPVDANNTSFWWGTTAAGPFTATTDASTQFSTLTGWSHDSGLGAVASSTGFSGNLSGLTPNTTYYYVAWVNVGGTWYPGNVMSFTTNAVSLVPPSTIAPFLALVHPLDLAIDSTHWYYYNDFTNTASVAENATHRITANPVALPGDNGAVELDGGLGARTDLATTQYSGTKLKDIAAIGYSTYQPTTNLSGIHNAPFLGLDINFGTTTVSGWEGRLNYVPGAAGNTPAPVQGTWQSYEGVQSNGMWEWSHFAANGNKWPDGNTSHYRTWNDIINAFPNAEIMGDGNPGQLTIRAGDPYSSTYNAYIDHVYLATSTEDTQYNFELAGSSGPSFSPTSGGSGGLIGDINHDGHVNFLDFALLMGAYGTSGPNISADLNHDGTVNLADLSILLEHWTG